MSRSVLYLNLRRNVYWSRAYRFARFRLSKMDAALARVGAA